MPTCPVCGTDNEPGNAFCNVCGERLAQQQPGAEEAAGATPEAAEAPEPTPDAPPGAQAEAATDPGVPADPPLANEEQIAADTRTGAPEVLYSSHDGTPYPAGSLEYEEGVGPQGEPLVRRPPDDPTAQPQAPDSPEPAPVDEALGTDPAADPYTTTSSTGDATEDYVAGAYEHDGGQAPGPDPSGPAPGTPDAAPIGDQQVPEAGFETGADNYAAPEASPEASFGEPAPASAETAETDTESPATHPDEQHPVEAGAAGSFSQEAAEAPQEEAVAGFGGFENEYAEDFEPEQSGPAPEEPRVDAEEATFEEEIDTTTPHADTPPPETTAGPEPTDVAQSDLDAGEDVREAAAGPSPSFEVESPPEQKEVEPLPQPGTSAEPATITLYVNREPVLEHEIDTDETLIGRKDPVADAYPDIDLTEFDPEGYVSRKHAYIYRQNRNYTLYVVSNAGTQLGDEMLSIGDRRPLSDGDVIVLAGQFAFKFEA